MPRPRVVSKGGKVWAYIPKKYLDDWHNKVLLAVRKQYSNEPVNRAVRVDVKFYFPLPKSGEKSLVKKPDLDNLVKGVLDALNKAGVWEDDSQVVELKAEKMFSEVPGARIEVECV
mgnify:CR=1 FL=1